MTGWVSAQTWGEGRPRVHRIDTRPRWDRWFLHPNPRGLRWLLALCGYGCGCGGV